MTKTAGAGGNSFHFAASFMKTTSAYRPEDPRNQAHQTDPKQDPKTSGTTPPQPAAVPEPVDEDNEETPVDPGAANVQPDTSGETDPGASNIGGVHPL
ncbi:hypothetical protein [Hymenobacter koreensis]|uniref:Uncharacterized protein n=1 Tax=Hymenobacter koreensis TaxID=1084523 RepID=A0ABP8IVT0_9BACT